MSTLEEQMVSPPALSVIAGYTYLERAQVFNRWFLSAYQTSFRWTGNRSDAEDATTWIFMNAMSRTRLPELVDVVDGRVADATLEAASRHWYDRYGVARCRCSEINASEAAIAGRPAPTLDALVDGLSAEMRLVIVLRFLRRRAPSAIAAQLGVPAKTANSVLYTALSMVAERIGLDADHDNHAQADQVATYVDDLVAKHRPLRFEADPAAWAALLAASYLQAAIAGNDLPATRFVRSLEESFAANRHSWGRRHVTHLRIWTA